MLVESRTEYVSRTYGHQVMLTALIDFVDNVDVTASFKGVISVLVAYCHGYTYADVTNRGP